jgi:hypothetical protein
MPEENTNETRGPTGSTELKHIVLLALENRSAHHTFYEIFRRRFPESLERAFGGTFVNYGLDGRAYRATATARTVTPVGPRHDFDSMQEQIGNWCDMSGFASSCERTALAQRIAGRAGIAMECQPLKNVLIFDKLVQHFSTAVNWHCFAPTETMANLHGLYTGTSDGEVANVMRWYTQRSVFDQLKEHGKGYAFYHFDAPQALSLKSNWNSLEALCHWFPFPEFARHVRNGELPHLAVIQASFRTDIENGTGIVHPYDVGNTGHPDACLVPNHLYDTWTYDGPNNYIRAQQLVAQIYEALRANPALFQETLFIITWDESGGYFDPKPPLVVSSPDDKTCVSPGGVEFDFTLTGPRVGALLVSGAELAEQIVWRDCDHTSFIKLVMDAFMPGAQPLTARVEWAPSLIDLWTGRPRPSLPDLSGLLPAERRSGQKRSLGLLAAAPVAPPYGDMLSQLKRVAAVLGAQQKGAPRLPPTLAEALLAAVDLPGQLAAQRLTALFERVTNYARDTRGG